MRGATPRRAVRINPVRRFQSTHPMRGATTGRIRETQAEFISIHAPHAGCDQTAIEAGLSDLVFQSTHPMRGATRTHSVQNTSGKDNFNPRTPCGVRREDRSAGPGIPGISIHAPHAGCDQLSVKKKDGSTQFQSTHPMRGATFDRSCFRVTDINFNPRTPCGVRHLELARYYAQYYGISIHAPHAGCDTKNSFTHISRTEISIHAPHAGCDTGSRL